MPLLVTIPLPDPGDAVPKKKEAVLKRPLTKLQIASNSVLMRSLVWYTVFECFNRYLTTLNIYFNERLRKLKNTLERSKLP